MSKISFIIIAVLVLFVGSNYAQKINTTELKNKVNELEKRIEILEKVIINNNTVVQNETTNNEENSVINWRKLFVGMKEIEVRKLLGEPKHVTRLSPNHYIWEYDNEGIYGKVTFDSNGVYFWDEPR